jgi:hypothetical protein
MAVQFQSSDLNARVQILQAHLRLRIVAVFISMIAILAYVGFARSGVYRIAYLGLALAGAIALAVQYRRERTLVFNRLSAVGRVTEYRVPLNKLPNWLGLLLSHLAPRVPRIKYSFLAFDQKTYTGETGWNAAGLRQGSQITILYNPQSPAANHPLRSFVFYSLR